MAMHTFTVKEAILFGWATFKKNWQFLIKAFLIIVVVSMIPSWLHDWAKNNYPTTSFLFSIIGWLVQMITGIGVIVISLKFVDGKKAEFSDIYKDYNLLLNYFLGSLLYGIVVIVGLILLVVPGIIWGIKYQYITYLIIDKKMGVWDAFKKSGQITQRQKMKLFWLGLSFIGITILGILAVGIGLLIAWPVIALSGAYVYRRLESR
jgi:uncharacterized membrane protein